MDRIIEKKTWTKKKIALIAGGVLLAVFLIYTVLFANHSASLNVKTGRLTIAEASRGNFQEFIAIDGSVEPLKTIYLDMVEGGRVEKLYTDDGRKMKGVAEFWLRERAKINTFGEKVSCVPVNEDDAATVILEYVRGYFPALVRARQPLIAVTPDRAVVHDPEGVTLLQQSPREVAADEAAASGDQGRFGGVEHRASQCRAARAAMVLQ